MSYATTPTLSVDAPHDSVRLVCPMFEQLGWPGWVGCWVSPDAPTVSLSTFGPPLAVVAVARILLVPALNPIVNVLSAQVSQLPVPGNDSPARTSVPLTLTSMGRSTVVPLAYRITALTLPAAAALNVHSTKLPATFV